MLERVASGAGIVGAVLVIVSGCAVGPEHRAPSQPPASVYLRAPLPQAEPQGAEPIASFWRRFGDPALDRLVERSLDANLDVQLAESRLREAQSLVDAAAAERRPTLGIDASATRRLAPQYEQPGRSRSERTGNVFAASGLMNWELDLFGRRQRALESAAALAAAERYGIGSAQTAVVAQVAGEYFALRGIGGRLQVAELALANQRESLRIAQARLAVGRGTELDVTRVRGLVASTAAGVPALQADYERRVHRLATLSGGPATEILRIVQPDAAAGAPPPALPALAETDLAQLPVGTPENLLARRADILSAERQLASASAEIGVAMADRFPRLSVSGLLGLADPRAGDLARSAATTASVGAALSWSAWDFGRTDARIDGARERHAAARLRYRQTVLNALEETETALSGYSRTTQQAVQLADAAEQNAIAARIARTRFAAGSTDLLAVLDAERQVLEAQNQLVEARTSTATALVEVYRALGGGWPADAAAAVR